MKAEDDFELQLVIFKWLDFGCFPFLNAWLKKVQNLLPKVMFVYKRKCTEIYCFLEEVPTIDTQHPKSLVLLKSSDLPINQQPPLCSLQFQTELITIMTSYSVVLSLSIKTRGNISLFSISFKYHYLLNIFPCLQKTVAKTKSWTHYSKRKMTSYLQLTTNSVWSSRLPVPNKNKWISNKWYFSVVCTNFDKQLLRSTVRHKDWRHQ